MIPDEQILAAFLRLAAERGFRGVTIQTLAAEAGVNAVTLFRRFGSKTALAVAAVRRFSPAPQLASADPAISVDHPLEDLVDALWLLVQRMTDTRQMVPWLRPGIYQLAQIPEVAHEVQAVFDAIYQYVRRVLEKAAPVLRTEVDRHVATLQLVGLIHTAGHLHMTPDSDPMPPERWRTILRAALRPWLQEV